MKYKLTFFYLLFLFSITTSEQIFSRELAPPQTFVEVAKKALPAVVFIEAEMNTPPLQQQEMPFGFQDPFWNRFFEPQQKSPTPQRRENKTIGRGSGAIITSTGYIITNNHLVKDADKILVTLYDKREFTAKLIGLDPHTDLAIIKIEEKGLPFLEIGNSDALQIGEPVAAIGNPFGLQASFSTGVVSAVARTGLQLANFESFIQTDAAINQGNSGGPLLNLEGEIIGINTALASNTGSYIGIGFAIPSNMAKIIKDQLVETGSVIRGFLGVALQEINQELAEAFHLKEIRGALVAEVVPNTPADAAGINQGDVILEYNGKKVTTSSALRNTIALIKPGAKLNLTLQRQGQEKQIQVTIGDHPNNAVSSTVDRHNPLGIEVESITDELAKRFGLKSDTRGVIINRIKKGSLAAQAQLRIGNLIRSVDMSPVNTPKEFHTLVKKGLEHNKRILLVVRQQHGERFISISTR